LRAKPSGSSDDCGPARDIRPFAVAEISSAAPLDLGQLGIPRGVEFGLTDAGDPDHVIVAHDNGDGTVDYGAHRQFRLRRNAELADQDQIQRGVECGCDFGGNRYTAARQREDNRVLILVAREAPASCRPASERSKNGIAVPPCGSPLRRSFACR
jgi:hypothetical protein